MKVCSNLRSSRNRNGSGWAMTVSTWNPAHFPSSLLLSDFCTFRLCRNKLDFSARRAQNNTSTTILSQLPHFYLSPNGNTTEIMITTESGRFQSKMAMPLPALSLSHKQLLYMKSQRFEGTTLRGFALLRLYFSNKVFIQLYRLLFHHKTSLINKRETKIRTDLAQQTSRTMFGENSQVAHREQLSGGFLFTILSVIIQVLFQVLQPQEMSQRFWQVGFRWQQVGAGGSFFPVHYRVSASKLIWSSAP